MEPRLFNLDAQLIHDAVFLMISMLVMFTLLSYFLFNPVRDFLKKRQERIEESILTAKKDREAAKALREEYEAKLCGADKEAEQILADARKKALKLEAHMIEEAKKEAALILRRADKQIELDRKKAADDMKRELVELSALIAAKAAKGAVNVEIQEAFVKETLDEIGEGTWQS